MLWVVKGTGADDGDDGGDDDAEWGGRLAEMRKHMDVQLAKADARADIRAANAVAKADARAALQVADLKREIAANADARADRAAEQMADLKREFTESIRILLARGGDSVETKRGTAQATAVGGEDEE